MYRSYENPEALKQELNNLKKQFENTKDFDEKIDLHNKIEDIKAHINFAYQDIEADENPTN